jgi:hypothetical protein
MLNKILSLPGAPSTQEKRRREKHYETKIRERRGRQEPEDGGPAAAKRLRVNRGTRDARLARGSGGQS